MQPVSRVGSRLNRPASKWLQNGLIAVFMVAVAMFFVTMSVLSYWLVETRGISVDGQIVRVQHCYGRYEDHNDVHLNVSFVDGNGNQRTSETGCEQDIYVAGQVITIRYLPIAPWFILMPEDIGDGQGPYLIAALAVDGICYALIVWGIVYYRRRNGPLSDLFGTRHPRTAAQLQRQSRAMRNLAHTRAVRARLNAKRDRID